MKNFITNPQILADQWGRIDNIPFGARINPLLRKAIEHRVTAIVDLKAITSMIEELNSFYEKQKSKPDVTPEFLDYVSLYKEQELCAFLQAKKFLKCSDTISIYDTFNKGVLDGTIKHVSHINNSVCEEFNKDYLESIHVFFEPNRFVSIIRSLAQRSKLFRELPNLLASSILLSINRDNCIRFLIDLMYYSLKYQATLALYSPFGGYELFKKKREFLITYTDYSQRKLKISLRGVFYLYNFCFDGRKVRI